MTVEALNTQKELAREVRAQGVDYVLALKGNHPTLCHEVQGIFEAVREDDNADGALSTTVSVETDHESHNLLQQEKTLKRGIKTKRFLTALDEAYSLKVLNLNPSGP